MAVYEEQKQPHEKNQSYGQYEISPIR